MHFEWDRAKAESNRRKHKVAFDEAVSVFYDPLSATFPDPAAGQAEQRFITIGHSSQERLLVVVHTEQGATIRIISARLATAHERKRHES
jgi:uncharacterized DUF497 family protein